MIAFQGVDVGTRYMKPSIKEAIVRVEISPPLDVTEEFVESSFAVANESRFSDVEPRTQVIQEFMFGPNGMGQKNVKSREWQLFGPDRDRRTLLANDHLAVSYTKYSQWAELKSDFVQMLDCLASTYPKLQIVRLGVRYINSITLEESDPFKWSGWIDDRLTGPLAFPEDPRRITRSMHVLELSYPEGVVLKYQFGMANPDYPAPAKQKNFVLDLDASISRILNTGEVKATLDPMHRHIEELFEASIGGRLRQHMGRMAGNEA